jgi:hypothetical protein
MPHTEIEEPKLPQHSPGRLSLTQASFGFDVCPNLAARLVENYQHEARAFTRNRQFCCLKFCKDARTTANTLIWHLTSNRVRVGAMATRGGLVSI